MLAAGARYLETRARSVAEFRRHLVGAGYRPELVEATIARLTDLGFLDDDAFATAWVEARDRSRPRGATALRSELRAKGIDEATIRRVIAEREPVPDVTFDGPSADEAAAERLLERRGRAILRVADPRVRRERAYGLLARSGFGPDVAASAAARFVRTADEAAADDLAGDVDAAFDPESGAP
ncbi:MAG: hypothetical protein RL338_1808 [Chloroflexota bacterium]